jgi:hypothetical protein
MSILTDAILITTANGYKASKLYSLKPFDGSGDFDVVRATTAWRRDESGVWVEEAANVPRLHYPVGGGCPSVLVEPQRTNLLLNSETLSTQSVTTAASNYTISFEGTGSITLSGAATGTLNGVVGERVSLTFTATAGSVLVTVSGVVEYANFELGNSSTSWIETIGTTITRNADVISNTSATSIIGQSEGTILVDIFSPFTASSKDFSLSDGTLNNRISFGYLSVANRFTLQIVKGGVIQVSNTFTPVNQDIRNKIIITYSPNDFQIWINGDLLNTFNSGETFTNQLTNIQLNRGNTQNPYFGEIYNFSLWNTKLTPQQITTL